MNNPFDLTPIPIDIEKREDVTTRLSMRYMLDFSRYQTIEERLIAIQYLCSVETNNQLMWLNLGDLIHQEIPEKNIIRFYDGPFLEEIDLSKFSSLKVITFQFKAFSEVYLDEYLKRMSLLFQKIKFPTGAAIKIIRGLVIGGLCSSEHFKQAESAFIQCTVNTMFLQELMGECLMEEKPPPALMMNRQLVNMNGHVFRYHKLFLKTEALCKKLRYHYEKVKLFKKMPVSSMPLLSEMLKEEYRKIEIEAKSPLYLF